MPISPTDDTAMENLTIFIIRTFLSPERTIYLDQEGNVIYRAKDGQSNRTFPTMEWLGVRCFSFGQKSPGNFSRGPG
jgi:hypothetical protein